MFGRKKQASPPALPVAQTVPRGFQSSNAWLYGEVQSHAERALYASLRQSVPLIDAALGKIVRLIGSFRVVTEDSAAQAFADDLLENVRTNGGAAGLTAFVGGYLDDLLTYGEAIGEMLPDERLGGICALYNASLNDAAVAAGSSPLEPVVLADGKPVENQSLMLVSLLNPESGSVRGRSLLAGLPFISSILLRVFASLKNNWERAGDIRFAVTYDPKDGVFGEESAQQIADEWKKAMRGDSVCDFVSLGDVKIKVIGAENQMPDCEVPVRVILEQIVAKLGIPPFLLGISWSSTERMSAQQADILTSELEYYRAAVEPVIRKIVRTHLRLCGMGSDFKIIWSDINLQDAVELSQARLNNARARQLERETGWEDEDETE